MSASDYIRFTEFKAGHRYWIHKPSGRIAVSDQSGYTPDQTDDGLMFLDFARRLDCDDAPHVYVPVVMPDGRQFKTCAGPGPEAAFVQHLFNGTLVQK